MKRQKAPITRTRRLSFWRVLLALVIVAGIGYGVLRSVQWWHVEQTARSARAPWFAAYVDVTATPTFAFEQMGTTAQRDAILSFIVADPNDGCRPMWGAAYTLDAAGEKLDLDRRIARLQQQGGSIAVSFGGLLNTELAVGCTDTNKLAAAYQAVIDRYDIDTIDLDLEKTNLANAEAAQRRAAALAQLQKQRRSQGKPLAIWLTLPVAPQGLTEDGTNAVAALLKGGVDLAGVNAMTMDYGQSRKVEQSMLDASKSALAQTHRQLGILYQQAGITLGANSVWAKLGATPMIGQNDFPEEVFTLDDAKGLNAFARDKGMSRMSMWSANRDVPCGSNYVNLKVVSTSCSGVKDAKQSFAVALAEGFDGSMVSSANAVTTAEPVASADELKDDPANSPYQIWSPTGAYLEGTKVVWHRNVYQAKWWTQGDVPDNPVLQTWQTPWELVGPVLPGEKPVAQATVPAGTYPEWSGETGYDAGQRVLFQGVPYQAKWWTKGDSPAAATANADSSPWVPLTQAQINEITQ